MSEKQQGTVKWFNEAKGYGFISQESGPDVFAHFSAIQGDGIDELLETLLLTADLHEYRANPDRPAMGTCLVS